MHFLDCWFTLLSAISVEGLAMHIHANPYQDYTDLDEFSYGNMVRLTEL